MPDGMKIDAEGNLFCTGPGGLHVFAPDGQMLGVIRVPEATGNFNWGDVDRKTLYICATSSLYSCRISSRGRRPRRLERYQIRALLILRLTLVARD